MVISADQYDLFQTGVLKKLAEEPQFFYTCVTANYYLFARKFRCKVYLSKHRLEVARQFWIADLKRLLDHDSDENTEQLDEFKQCAFLTFWLRRHHPLEKIEFAELANNEARSTYNKIQKWYATYGNDFSAIKFGSTICLNYCASSIEHMVSSSEDGGRTASINTRKIYLRRFRNRIDFWADFAMILKHKNNSPHSITLIYEALFGFTLPPIRHRELTSGGI